MTVLNKEITDKFKKLRVEKGYTQEDLANELNISRTAYHNIESPDSYVWAKYLPELMKIFDTTPNEFFKDIGGKMIVNYCSFSQGAIGYVENLQQENSDVYKQLLDSKDEIIELLKNKLNNLEQKS